MSISGIGSSPKPQDLDADAHASALHGATRPAALAHTPSELDFASSSSTLAAVHLPSARIAPPKPSVATLVGDAHDVEAKIQTFRRALTSPAIKNAVTKNAAALATLTKIELTLGIAIIAIATLKEKGIAALGTMWLADKAMSNGKNLLSLPSDLSKLFGQLREALPTFGYAAPDLLRTMGAGVDVLAAAAKLASDLERHGGV